jgi:hypothetical protein
VREVPTPAIRDIILTEIRKAEQVAKNGGPTMQQGSVLQAAANELKKSRAGAQPSQYLTPELELALLTEWGELFRTGLVAWGLNLSNPNPPFFHLTGRGLQALANATRDPSNPFGYLRNVDAKASLNPVARSYLIEGLECYAAGFFKEGAVMVGGAAESLIVELAEIAKQRLTALGKNIPKPLNDWRVKIVTDGVRDLLENQKDALPKDLREPFEAYWPAFVQQIRSARNDAGHPTSIDPVTPDTVHASLLIFPELAQLTERLKNWMCNQLS